MQNWHWQQWLLFIWFSFSIAFSFIYLGIAIGKEEGSSALSWLLNLICSIIMTLSLYSANFWS